MQDNTTRNMEDLMNAAKLKLEKQKEIEMRNNPPEDLYADMRSDIDTDYPDVPVRYSQSPDEEILIKYQQDENEINNNFYVDPQDTPIFDGGPGISQIQIWKKQFSKESVMHTQILERHFVFRTLNRYEYKQIVAISNVDALYREEVICRTCVLWPYDYDFKQMAIEDSGYPSTLAQIIMENSGFTKEYGIEVL